jgi:hypothetical protein
MYGVKYNYRLFMGSSFRPKSERIPVRRQRDFMNTGTEGQTISAPT